MSAGQKRWDKGHLQHVRKREGWRARWQLDLPWSCQSACFRPTISHVSTPGPWPWPSPLESRLAPDCDCAFRRYPDRSGDRFGIRSFSQSGTHMRRSYPIAAIHGRKRGGRECRCVNTLPRVFHHSSNPTFGTRSRWHADPWWFFKLFTAHCEIAEGQDTLASCCLPKEAT